MTTLTEFFTSMSTATHEARLVVTDFLSSKAAFVATYVAEHPSELLYGSVSVSLLALACFLAYKLTRSDGLLTDALNDIKVVERSRTVWRNNFLESHRDNSRTISSLHGEKSELEDTLEDLRGVSAFRMTRINSLFGELATANESLAEAESDRDSYEEQRDDAMANASYWEDQCEEARGERNEYETERDDFEEQVEDLEGELSRLRDKNRELVTLVANYKELTAMNDSVMAQAA